MFNSPLLDKMTDIFQIERNGSMIGSAKGFMCGPKYPANTIQLIEDVQILPGDWLIFEITHQRYYVTNCRPVPNPLNGPRNWIVSCQTESEYAKTNDHSVSINIGNVNGPSIIGSQQNATINTGASIEDIKALISCVSDTDKSTFNELVEEIESVENSKHPVLIAGMLSRFENLLNKYPNILSTLGSWAVKLLIGQ